MEIGAVQELAGGGMPPKYFGTIILLFLLYFIIHILKFTRFYFHNYIDLHMKLQSNLSYPDWPPPSTGQLILSIFCRNCGQYSGQYSGCGLL